MHCSPLYPTCIRRYRQLTDWGQPVDSSAWFTFSSRQHEVRQERECEDYIRLVCLILNLFLSRLEALGNMSVNRIRVNGHKCLASLLKLRSTLPRSSRIMRVWMPTFVRTSSHSHLTESFDMCLRWESKPGISNTSRTSLAIYHRELIPHSFDRFEPLYTNMYLIGPSDGAVSHYPLRLEIYGKTSAQARKQNYHIWINLKYLDLVVVLIFKIKKVFTFFGANFKQNITFFQ